MSEVDKISDLSYKFRIVYIQVLGVRVQQKHQHQELQRAANCLQVSGCFVCIYTQPYTPFELLAVPKSDPKSTHPYI